MQGRERGYTERGDVGERRKSKKGQRSEIKMKSKKTRGGLEGENKMREVETRIEKAVEKV